ncbi:MOSC domain-containing protein [Parasedimentitalea huanghaiensis]|uniref:MOSC domain-containing protein n=1 Tax=Parasedimentitalea huanghaiensis TaxID=2682100 RepID=A0A6L6WNQ8_9RHOB|nr:MOSC domain-containing protein [Zongyanglinia huanghaiensis]MVO18699.1 MOSC domain-containing protein [Zongyanglinia huanghaiensis]
MNCPALSATINGVFVGRIEDHWFDKPPSAIHKIAADGPQTVTTVGFDTDAQADLSVHGGPDKAIHHYAADHYASWQSEGLLPPGTLPAAFGENLSTFGMNEETLCIGDILTAGSAILQISQGRQPCWKLNEHTGQKTMAYQFQKTGRTGWYYRVLEPGTIQVGDIINLTSRPCPDWSVAKVTRARLTKRIAAEEAAYLSRLPELASGWRDAFRKLAIGQLDEDTRKRLNPD